MAAKELVALADSVGDIDTSAPLSIFEAYGKVFICNGTKKKVVDFVNVKLTSANVAADADNAPHYGTILTGGTSGAKMVTDYITSMTGACVLYGKRTTDDTFESGETVTGTNSDGNAVSFAISANEDGGAVTGGDPHWYNWTVYGGSTTYGTMPDQITLGCLWAGSALIAGDVDYPHQWCKSRAGGNVWDFNYISNDAQSPVAGGENPDTPGQVGDIVISLIPHTKDYCIVGCVNSMWYFVGNPSDGGDLLPLLDKTGILNQTAWCKDAYDNIYILTTQGLIKITAGLLETENLTAKDYPYFIKDMSFNASTHKIVMGFDRDRNGVKIAKTTLADGTNNCWWFDLSTGGLFPETYPEECAPYSMFYYEAVDSANSGLLAGCTDGFIRISDDDAEDDDIGPSDEAIESYVTFGPVHLSREENKEGTIESIVGITVGGQSGGTITDSDNITCKVWVGGSADEVVEKMNANSNPDITEIINAPGRDPGAMKRRKVRGIFAGIRIENVTAAEKWGLERIIINGKQSGRSK